MEGTTRNLETNFEVKENLYDFKESFVNFPKPFAFRIEWQLYVGLYWFFFKLGSCLYHSIHLQNYYVYRFPATIIGVISIFSCSSVSWVEFLSLGGRFDRSPETKTLALIIYKYPFSFQKILYNCRVYIIVVCGWNFAELFTTKPSTDDKNQVAFEISLYTMKRWHFITRFCFTCGNFINSPSYPFTINWCGLASRVEMKYFFEGGR